jgi:AcrR family transcriptional regulator
MTRERILQSAITLFARYGLRGVSVDTICHSVGIAKKTYYTLYDSKDELVEDFVETTFAEFFHFIQQSSREIDAVKRLNTFDEKLMTILRVFNLSIVADLKRNHEKAFRAFMNHRSALAACLAAVIEYGKRQGTFRNTIDSSVLAELRLLEIEMLFSAPPQTPFSDLHNNHEQLFEHYVAGLLADVKGSSYLTTNVPDELTRSVKTSCA